MTTIESEDSTAEPAAAQPKGGRKQNAKPQKKATKPKKPAEANAERANKRPK